MKIALLTLEFPPRVGGVQRYLYEIATGLARRHQVTVITTVPGILPETAGLSRVVVAATRVRVLGRVLREVEPARVIIGHVHPRLLLAAALFGAGRYVTIAHGDDYLAAQTRWHRPFLNHLLARSRPLITQSSANAERLGLLGMRDVRVIHPGTDPSRFAPGEHERRWPPVLLTVARLVPRKGVDVTLEALTALLPEFPNVRYRVVGDGPDRSRLEDLALRLAVRSRVDFLGQVSEDALPQIYRDADVFVLPVRERPREGSVEGFGIVYLEASASGLPVVGSRSWGTPDAVRDGETGLLVVAEPKPVAEALGRLLRDPDRRRRLGAAGRRWVEREMNWQRAVGEVESSLDA